MKEQTASIETGFPSPATDHLEATLNLEELVVKRPAATFYVRAKGNAMQKNGIYDGDILVVDRSLTATDGSIVIAAVNDEIVIRQLIKRGDQIYLACGHQNYPPVHITPETEWMIWGVVTYLIHSFRSKNIDKPKRTL